MAGVLGTFMRHSRNRLEIARRREQLKAEREVSVCFLFFFKYQIALIKDLKIKKLYNIYVYIKEAQK